MSVVNYRFLFRRGLAAFLAALNEIVLDGEAELEKDTGRFKIGNGSDHYNDLLYNNLGRVDFATLADTYVPTWDAANQKFVFAPSGGGGGGSTLIATATLVAPGTTLTIATSSFNLSASKRLRVIVKGKNNTAGDAGYVKLYLNADTTDANYYSQIGAFAGGGVSAARNNDPSLVYEYASACFEMQCELKLDLDGKCRITAMGEANTGPASVTYRNGIYYQTAVNITGLSIVAPANMAVGSTVEVWTW